MSLGGGYEISLDKILFADDTQSNTTTAAPADVSPLREINTKDDVAGAEGEAIENIEVQPGLASYAPGYGGADEDDSPSRGGVDAAGLEEHSSNSSNEEPAADLKGYISRRVIISWDLHGGPPGVVYAWAHCGAHAYEHHVNYDDTRRWHDLGNYGRVAARDLHGGPPGVVYAWAHCGAHAYEHHVDYDDTRRWHDLGNYGAGRPRGDAAAGALSAGAITASALSAGANEPESKRGRLGHAAADELSTGRPPGGEDAGALSTESTGRSHDDAAAGAPRSR